MDSLQRGEAGKKRIFDDLPVVLCRLLRTSVPNHKKKKQEEIEQRRDRNCPVSTSQAQQELEARTRRRSLLIRMQRLDIDSLREHTLLGLSLERGVSVICFLNE